MVTVWEDGVFSRLLLMSLLFPCCRNATLDLTMCRPQ